MKSFGIWYRKNSEYGEISEETYVSDLHINLWDMKEKRGWKFKTFSRYRIQHKRISKI